MVNQETGAGGRSFRALSVDESSLLDDTAFVGQC
jgi:hypothetical protein